MVEVPNDVIKAAAGGDHRAFEEIYKATSAYVYAVALRVCGNAEDSQEVVQDVFVALHKDLRKFEFRAKLTTWMYRITVNRAINIYKKMKRKREREVRDEIMPEGSVDPVDIETGIDAEANERAVTLLLSRLNPDQRACIILREVERMPYEEMSKVLNVNINTVRTRIKRAREILMKDAPKKEERNGMR